MPHAHTHPETPAEERLNCVTHGIGAVLSLVALVLLTTLAAMRGELRHVLTVTVFGLTLLVLYLTSTIYHGCRTAKVKQRLQIVDHAAIYCLIAGSYTPFLLVLVRGHWGWGLFAVLWALAVFGTLFKIFFAGRFDVVSSLIYVAMGWSGVVAAGPLLERLPGGAVAWMLAGGIAYTAGVVFYLWDRLPFNHAVWHLFVLTGSACHVLAVLFYVIPG